MRNSTSTLSTLSKLSIAFLICVALFTFATPVAAQTAQTAVAATSNSFVAAGASFNGTTVTPFGSYGQQLGLGIYAITSVQVTRITLKPTIAFQTVTMQDFGYDFSKLLPVALQSRIRLVGLGGAGASASSTALAGAFDGGGLGIVHFKYFNLALGAKVIKTPQSGVQTLPMLALSVHL